MPPLPAVVPVPFTVKLPLVLLSTMPLAPPVADTLVSAMTRGVAPLIRVISMAGAPLVVIAPLDVVIVLVFSCASSPR